MLFHKIQYCVQAHGNDAQDHNGHQYPSELKGLAAVDDKIAKAGSCADKFTDDDTNQAKSDIHLHNTEDEGDGRGQDDFCQLFFFVSAKGFDQLQLIRVSLAEAGIQADDGAEDGDGHTGHDDGTLVCTEPHDEKGGKGRFREAVEDHKVRLQDPGCPRGTPQKDGCPHTQDHNKEEADKGFCQGDCYVGKKGLVPAHGEKCSGNEGGAAENKGIDPSVGGGHFP